MRIAPVALIAVLLGGQLHADLIPLSETRSVSVSGVAGGRSYSSSQSSSDAFGDFTASVSGSADWTNPSAPPNTGWFHADSRAVQTSTISADQISVNASLLGNTRVSLAGPYGPTGAFGSSIFEVTFDLATPVDYTLGISRSVFGHDLPRPNLEFSLSSATYGSVLGNDILSLFSGMLMPDRYTLRFNADFSAVADPLGDVKLVDYSMNFRVAQVPDAGSSVTLLLMALAGLVVLKLKVIREAAIHSEI
jgi:hypothetical protein